MKKTRRNNLNNLPRFLDIMYIPEGDFFLAREGNGFYGVINDILTKNQWEKIKTEIDHFYATPNRKAAVTAANANLAKEEEKEDAKRREEARQERLRAKERRIKRLKDALEGTLA